MQYNRRVDAGCTVLDPPYALEDRLALKDHTELLKPVEYWAPASTTRSLNAPNNSLLVLPCLMKPDLVPPVMFGPNISGSFTLQKAGEFNSAHGDILEGPFYKSSSKKGQFNNAAEWASEAPRVLFSASRSSSKYGNSTSVQPASIRLIHCIKS